MRLLTLILIAFLVNLKYDMPFDIWVGLILTTFLLIDIILNSYDNLVFKSLICLALIVQCQLVPAYFYHFLDLQSYGDQLVIDIHPDYFKLATPGSIIFFFLFYFTPQKVTLEFPIVTEFLRNGTNIGYAKKLAIIGIIGTLSGKLNLPGFAFISTLFYEVLFISGLYLAFAIRKKIVIWLILLVQFIVAMIGGMIGVFFVSVVFFGIYYMLLYKFSPIIKLLILFVFLSLGMFLQSVKFGYRLAKWEGKGKLANESSWVIWKTVINKQLKGEGIYTKNNFVLSTVRLNQGFLSSLTFKHVPKYEPFANGKTVKAALLSVIIPRIFWPDKPQVGGQEKMKKYAGIKLIGATSMNIGLYGESYINFGIFGGIIFIGLFALFLNWVYTLLLKKSIRNPYFLLWIVPFIRPMLDCGGNDLLYTLNYLAKASVVMLVLFSLIHKKNEYKYHTKTT